MYFLCSTCTKLCNIQHKLSCWELRVPIRTLPLHQNISILIHCLFLYGLPCCFQSVKAALSPCYFCKDINHPSGLLFCALLICTAFGKLWWKFVTHPGPTYVLCEGELACKKRCLKYSRGLIGYSHKVNIHCLLTFKLQISSRLRIFILIITELQI